MTNTTKPYNDVSRVQSIKGNAPNVAIASRFSLIVAITFALIGAITLITPTPAAAQGQSFPPGTSAPCGGQGGCTPSLTGNPIDIVTGNKYRREEDFQLPGALGLGVVRHYSSKASSDNVLGYNWRLSYDETLTTYKNNEWTLIRGDGRRLQFGAGVGAVLPTDAQLRGRAASGDKAAAELLRFRYVARDPADGILEASLGGFVWHQVNGEQHHFSKDGKLTRVQTPDNNAVTIAYNADKRIASITDQAGRSLKVSYYEESITGLNKFSDTPATSNGKQGNQAKQAAPPEAGAAKNHIKRIELAGGTLAVDYAYDRAGNLTQVSYPDGTKKYYHYEQFDFPHHLTRIVERDGKDQFYFAYDNQGRAIRSERPDGVERVTLTTQLPAPNVGRTKSAANPTDATEAGEGSTLLTNALGYVTLYTWRYNRQDNLPMITGALGPGCSGCPESNIRISYNERNQVSRVERLAIPAMSAVAASTVLPPAKQVGMLKVSNPAATESSATPQSTPTAAQLKQAQAISIESYEYDAYGRLSAQYREPINSVSSSGAKRGTYPADNRLLIARFSYAEGTANLATFAKPILVERPSVAPGNMHHVAIRYNARGQPLEVTERGFSPQVVLASKLADGMRTVALMKATDKTSATPATTYAIITRTNTTAYYEASDKTDDGKPIPAGWVGKVKRLDGPLPNGPKNDPSDSDVTLFGYDAKTYQLAHIAKPAGLTETFSYDELGRTNSQLISDGYRQIETRTQYASLGHILVQPERITRRAWLLQENTSQVNQSSEQIQILLTAKYDLLGRRTQSAGVDGLQKTLAYNVAGSPEALTFADGSQTYWAYDKDGQLLANLTQDAKGQVTGGDMWLRDAQGRPLAHLTPQGLQQIFVHSLGDADTASENKRGGAALASSRSANINSNLAALAESRIAPRIFKDDFGRLVVEAHREDGILTTRFEDTANGQRQTQTQRGTDGVSSASETLQFDFAGRLRQRIRSGCTETLTYQGPLLQTLQGCDNSHRFERDAFGQIVAHHQQMQVNGQSLTFAQQYRYNSQGQLASRTLLDGQMLSYTYDSQTAATQSVRLQSRWFSWVSRTLSPNTATKVASWLPNRWAQQNVVSDIKRHGTGNASAAPLHSLTHANAQVQSWMPQSADTTATALPSDSKQAISGIGSAPSASNTVNIANIQPANALNPENRSVQTSMKFAAQPVASPAPLAQSASAFITDAFGRQTQRQAKQQQRLVWDKAHRLTEVQDAQTQATIARYGYDTLGNRISKTHYQAGKAVHTQIFVYDTSHRIIAEADERGRIQRQYLYADHRVHSIIETNQLYAVETDWRGLPARVTDSEQQVVWQGQFDAWGNQRIGEQTNAQKEASRSTAGTVTRSTSFTMNLRLAGQYHDDETGLNYNIHRYFDPSRGQYISPDPMGAPDGPDRYAYVNGNPLAGIDPLGLFEIPVWDFANPNLSMPATDRGHGDILRIAFAQYNAINGNRFSQAVIDQIIRNNYHTDSQASPFNAGGGQSNVNNHFDNPNNGPMCQDKDCNQLMPGYTAAGGGKPDFMRSAINQVDRNRKDYARVMKDFGGNPDISAILSQFGQNSHALADFYAHSNWVDATTRGGYVCNDLGFYPIAEANKIRPDRKYVAVPGDPNRVRVYEVGYVATGLNQSIVWDESLSRQLMSGTVNKIAEPNGCPLQEGLKPGDIVCRIDKTTHGYWNKDDEGSEGGLQAYSDPEKNGFLNQGKFFWEYQVFDPSGPPKKPGPDKRDGQFGIDYFTDNGQPPKVGDRIYVAKAITNHHEMAFYLAIEHTKKEVAKLYDAAGGKKVGAYDLQNVYKMDKAELATKKISYTILFSKST